ncbi:MAG TPA: DUF1800 domain-containing protein [Acidimicrobiales bacterium]|jgi:uncharacterized protein (DUF1800 family)
MDVRSNARSVDFIEQGYGVDDDESEPPGPPDPPDPKGRDRRKILATGLGGSALAALGWLAKSRLIDRSDTPPPPSNGPRKAAFRAADAGGFTSREESYTAGKPADDSAAVLYPSASEAARLTKVTVPTILATDDPVLHLLRRTTYGLTPDLVDEVHGQGIDAWLATQLNPIEIPDPEADVVWNTYPGASMEPAQVQRSMARNAHDAMSDYSLATLGRMIWSKRQLHEVVVDFWANHFNVPMTILSSWDVGVSFQNDVIRTHALGSFTDMLLATMQHPGMLRYLSNALSNKTSVNENLGRELLELHTVGIGAGYTEDDVRNSAYILTGRTVANTESGAEGTFLYDPNKHWTGAVQVLDFTDPNASAAGGFDVGDAYLRYLANHPSTAQAIARKLAVRFVSDNPPQSLVDRLATAYLDGGTAIVPVFDIMFRSGEFWAAVGQKTRRPMENQMASIRALGLAPDAQTPELLDTMYLWLEKRLGQSPVGWRSPNGYPDVQAAWPSASGLLETWNTHRRLVQGWDGYTAAPASNLIGDRSQATVGDYIDSLCLRVCFQTFLPPHRDALLGFVGADAATPTDQSNLQDLVQHVVPLVLDSPYFALR